MDDPELEDGLCWTFRRLELAESRLDGRSFDDERRSGAKEEFWWDRFTQTTLEPRCLIYLLCRWFGRVNAEVDGIESNVAVDLTELERSLPLPLPAAAVECATVSCVEDGHACGEYRCVVVVGVGVVAKSLPSRDC